jgi:hypothetical protein
MKNRERLWFDRMPHLMLAGIVFSLLGACSSESNGDAEPVVALHACEILPDPEIGRIVGRQVSQSNVDVERNEGTNAISQCTWSFDDAGDRVTLQLRRQRAANVISRQADADRERTKDDGTGYGVEFATAIEAGTDIEGLGDFAYSFEVHGLVWVVVFWDDHYDMRVWMATDSGKDRAIQVGTEIARTAMAKL